MTRITQYQSAASDYKRNKCMEMAKVMFIKKRLYTCRLGEMGG